LLAALDALTSDRRDRLAAASHQLPVLYVVVLVLTGAALIVNAAALTLRSGWRPRSSDESAQGNALDMAPPLRKISFKMTGPGH